MRQCDVAEKLRAALLRTYSDGDGHVVFQVPNMCTSTSHITTELGTGRTGLSRDFIGYRKRMLAAAEELAVGFFRGSSCRGQGNNEHMMM